MKRHFDCSLFCLANVCILSVCCCCCCCFSGHKQRLCHPGDSQRSAQLFPLRHVAGRHTDRVQGVFTQFWRCCTFSMFFRWTSRTVMCVMQELQLVVGFVWVWSSFWFGQCALAQFFFSIPSFWLPVKLSQQYHVSTLVYLRSENPISSYLRLMIPALGLLLKKLTYYPLVPGIVICFSTYINFPLHLQHSLLYPLFPSEIVITRCVSRRWSEEPNNADFQSSCRSFVC